MALTKIGFTLIKDNFKDAVSGSSTAQSSSFSTRVTTAETELGNTLLSGSAQIATNISGSLGANATVIRNLSAAVVSGSSVSSSDSVSARVVSLEGSGTIQGVGTTNDVQFTNITGSEVSSSTALFTTATIDKIGGAIDFNNENMTNVDIDSGTITGITDLTVADGGTGVSTLTDGGVLLGSGAGAITAMSVLGDSEMIVGDGSTDPVAESGATLRTSIGVGLTDNVVFSNVSGAAATFNSATVNGLLTVEEIHTVFVSASVSVATGSNIFGDAIGDTHQFTGSIEQSGSLSTVDVTSDNLFSSNITGSIISGSTALLTTATIDKIGGAIDFDNQNMTNVDIDSGVITGITDLVVADGGTGVSTLTDGGVLLGNGAGAIQAMAVLTDGQMIVGDGTTDPVAESGATLRTSIGVGLTDDVVFSAVSGSTATFADYVGNVSGSSTSTGSFGYGQFTDKVGIGHTLPSAPLDVVVSAGSDALVAEMKDSGGNGLNFTINNSSPYRQIIGVGGGETLGLAANGITSVKMVIDGNSGISLSNNDNGTGNTIFGKSAGASLDAGSNFNTFIGEGVSDASMNDAIDNTAVGYQALSALTSGDDNTAVGMRALLDLEDGIQNTGIGESAGRSITSGEGNTAVGRKALDANTTGNINTAVGVDALGAFTGSGATAVGREALRDATGGTGHTAFGQGALAAITHGVNNTALGYAAGNDINTGNYNTLMGYLAGTKLTTGDANIAIGQGAMQVHITGNRNIAIGHNSMVDTDAGSTSYAANDNLFIGTDAGGGTWTNTACQQNVGIGNYSMDSALDEAQENTAVGYASLGSITTADRNTAIGYNAGTAINTGANNVIVGNAAGDAMTDNVSNVVIGKGALTAADSGENYNVIIGGDAGSAINHEDSDYAVIIGQDAGTGGAAKLQHIVAIGGQALSSTGTNAHVGTVAIGYNALQDNTTGQGNVAIGYLAAANTIAGEKNTAIGYNALETANHADADNNTVVGYQSGVAITSGADNTMIGANAGDAANVASGSVCVGSSAGGTMTTGNANTFVGYNAGANDATMTGDANVAVGYNTAKTLTTGAYNVFIGDNAAVAHTTGMNNVIIGQKAAQSNTGLDNCTIIGRNTSGNNGASFEFIYGSGVGGLGGNSMTIGKDSTNRIYNVFTSNATWTRSSDKRIKKDINTNIDIGLNFIKDLRTVNFKWKAPSEIPQEITDLSGKVHELDAYNESKTEHDHPDKIYGFIAQEVKETLDNHNIEGFSGWHEGIDGVQGVSYEMFVVPLVKAVQELSSQVTDLKKEIEDLKG